VIDEGRTAAPSAEGAIVKQLIPEFDVMKRRYPPGSDSSLVIPCLHRIQAERGHVADEDIADLAHYLAVPRVQVEEVLAHYSMFRRRPVGRWHLQACRNVSCSMRGAEGVIDHLARRLGFAPGQTTADGRFTLGTVECLGSCGTAPVVMVNEAYHENMSRERLDALIEELSR
jgi:NADH-quinone oxidoreductase subunit E